MNLIGQKWFYSGKSGCNLAKVAVCFLGKIVAKNVVVYSGQKWL